MKPSYLKVQLPSSSTHFVIKRELRAHTLFTVCEEAKCPNIAECWGHRTATFMILGPVCSRACRFCVVTHGTPTPVDPQEPEKLVHMVKTMNLKYVVITSVDRDDLPDFGSGHFSRVIQKVKELNVLVEVLIPDFQGDLQAIARIVKQSPAVIAHNIETVRRLTPYLRDKRAGYDQSLKVLKLIKELAPYQITKSSIMLGVGETDTEVIQTMKDLRNVGVNVITIGQYLRPSKMQLKVVEYSTPSRFKKFEKLGYELGFDFVVSGPLVRTSYKAAEIWAQMTAKYKKQ